MTVPRVVIDTNCLVSALLFSKDSLAWLRRSWQNGRFKPLVNKETVGELIRVLNYPKFRLEAEQQDILLAEFLPYAEAVKTTTTPVSLPSIRDQDDAIFLELAIAGKADALVSGDADMLAIRQDFQHPPILTLTEFALWLDKKARSNRDHQ